jgi:hypothetical protein
MASPKPHLPTREPTPQQWKFAEACASGSSLVDAFVAAYPPRGASRSREGERVKAKRLAKNPAVVWAMQQAAQRRAEEEAVENPEEVRKECLIALRRIRQGRLDVSHARAIMAELREANREIKLREEQARAQQRAEHEASWQLIQALEAMSARRSTAGAAAVPAPSPSAAGPPQITPPAQAHDPLPEPPATATTSVTPETKPDDELHRYVSDQRAARAAAAPRLSQREPSYLPGYFPPLAAWNAGPLRPPRTATLPTFTAHRTGKEVPVLTVIHERWDANTGPTARKKRKEPREPYY